MMHSSQKQTALLALLACATSGCHTPSHSWMAGLGSKSSSSNKQIAPDTKFSQNGSMCHVHRANLQKLRRYGACRGGCCCVCHSSHVVMGVKGLHRCRRVLRCCWIVAVNADQLQSAQSVSKVWPVGCFEAWQLLDMQAAALPCCCGTAVHLMYEGHAPPVKAALLLERASLATAHRLGQFSGRFLQAKITMQL